MTMKDIYLEIKEICDDEDFGQLMYSFAISKNRDKMEIAAQVGDGNVIDELLHNQPSLKILKLIAEHGRPQDAEFFADYEDSLIRWEYVVNCPEEKLGVFLNDNSFIVQRVIIQRTDLHDDYFINEARRLQDKKLIEELTKKGTTQFFRLMDQGDSALLGATKSNDKKLLQLIIDGDSSFNEKAKRQLDFIEMLENTL